MGSNGSSLKRTDNDRRLPETGEGSLLAAFSRYPNLLEHSEFRELVLNSEAWERKSAYYRLVKAITKNQLPPEVLLAFIKYEPNAKLSHHATQDFVRLKSCSIENEFAGIEQILDLYKTADIENAGAALAGLLSLGDRRVNALLRLLRPSFTQETLHEFTRIYPGQLCKASIEFYFDWIFELQHKPDTKQLGSVCSAMTVMLFHDETGFVVDHPEHACIGFKKPNLNQIPFVDYYKDVKPVLAKLHDANIQNSPMVQALISAWQNHPQTADVQDKQR